jgi:hypothetical protein
MKNYALDILDTQAPDGGDGGESCTEMIYLSAGIFVLLYSILLIIVIYMCVKYSREKPKEWENVNAFVRNLEQQRERQSAPSGQDRSMRDDKRNSVK